MSPKPTPVPEETATAERFTRYAPHIPIYPLRQTRVPVLLREHPTFRRLAEERAATLAAEARLAGEHAEMVARNELARDEHHAAQRRAMLAGEPPPGPLALEEWPWPQHTRPLFDRIHQAIEAAELGALAEDVTRWRRDLARRSEPARDALAEARASVRRLEAELAPYDEANAALARLGVHVQAAEKTPDAPDSNERAEAIERRMVRETTREEREAQVRLVADFEAAMTARRGARR